MSDKQPSLADFAESDESDNDSSETESEKDSDAGDEDGDVDEAQATFGDVETFIDSETESEPQPDNNTENDERNEPDTQDGNDESEDTDNEHGVTGDKGTQVGVTDSERDRAGASDDEPRDDAATSDPSLESGQDTVETGRQYSEISSSSDGGSTGFLDDRVPPAISDPEESLGVDDYTWRDLHWIALYGLVDMTRAVRAEGKRLYDADTRAQLAFLVDELTPGEEDDAGDVVIAVFVYAVLGISLLLFLGAVLFA